MRNNTQVVLLLAAALALAQVALAGPLEQQGGPAEGPGQITVVKLRGAPKQVALSEGDTAGQLRAKVAELEGAQADDVVMVFGGRHLKDEVPLSDYGIQANSRVIYILKSEVDAKYRTGKLEFVKVHPSSGNEFKIPVRPDMTVGELKRAIAVIRPHADPKSQLLVHDRSVLKDTSALSLCDLQDGATIELKLVSHDLLMTANFGHDRSFARANLVLDCVEQQLREAMAKGTLDELFYRAYKFESLPLHFGYSFRGTQSWNTTTLSEGVKWVAEQARLALEIEAAERDAPNATASPA